MSSESQPVLLQPRGIEVDRSHSIESSGCVESTHDQGSARPYNHGDLLGTQSKWRPSTVVTVGDGLSQAEREQLVNLLAMYQDVFASGSGDLGRTWVTAHKIDTGLANPTNVPPYRVRPAEREIIAGQVKEMLHNGVTRESESPWASPVVLPNAFV